VGLFSCARVLGLLLTQQSRHLLSSSVGRPATLVDHVTVCLVFVCVTLLVAFALPSIGIVVVMRFSGLSGLGHVVLVGVAFCLGVLLSLALLYDFSMIFR
jgi:hypothetical protein